MSFSTECPWVVRHPRKLSFSHTAILSFHFKCPYSIPPSCQGSATFLVLVSSPVPLVFREPLSVSKSAQLCDQHTASMAYPGRDAFRAFLLAFLRQSFPSHPATEDHQFELSYELQSDHVAARCSGLSQFSDLDLLSSLRARTACWPCSSLQL